MIDENTLKRVISYMHDYVDSEVDEEVRQALIWVKTGKINDNAPTIIACALEALEEDEKSS